MNHRTDPPSLLVGTRQLSTSRDSSKCHGGKGVHSVRTKTTRSTLSSVRTTRTRKDPDVLPTSKSAAVTDEKPQNHKYTEPFDVAQLELLSG